MLSEIYTWFTEGFDTQDLRDAKALLDELGLVKTKQEHRGHQIVDVESMNLKLEFTAEPAAGQGGLLTLALLALLVGVAAGLVGAVFRLSLNQADHLRDALITGRTAGRLQACSSLPLLLPPRSPLRPGSFADTHPTHPGAVFRMSRRS